MRELLKYFLIGALAIGGFVAVVWGWNNLFLPAWESSLVFRFVLLSCAALVFTTWFGAFLHATFTEDHRVRYIPRDGDCIGDGVVGE